VEFNIQADALIGWRPLVAATKEPDNRSVPEPSNDAVPVDAVKVQFVATTELVL
jgi:hypothetical protein